MIAVSLRAVAARYRIVALAILASLALHAAVMVGTPRHIAAIDARDEALYEATLDALPPPPKPLPDTRASQPSATPGHPRPRHAAPRVSPVAAADPMPSFEPLASMAPISDVPLMDMLQPVPEKLAMALPVAPPDPQPEPFPVDAMPAQMSIDYALTSAFADGHAEYRWRRDGDSYRITGQAAAEGVFALFLEGSIVQESTGTVTAAGLRPDQFTERKPGSAPEGVQFDWEGRRAVLERNGVTRTEPLKANTVDWLSMIFQLAHRPPSGEGMDIQVFTQRKLEAYHLQVVGPEEIDIPLGHVRTLHLRHVDPKDASQVDVWLGVDQHYVPVKLRFPVAKNRLTVEQVATRVTER